MGFRFSVTSVVFLILSLAYLGGEFAFNAMMLDVAGDISSAPAAIERVKDFGRFVSASGFTLLVLGLFTHSNFWVVTWRQWVPMAGVFFFCMIPAMFVLSGTSQVPVDGETAMTFLPLLGLFIAVLSGGKYRFYVILSVFLMSWPSMYAGQKILIEHYAVEKTSWQERADARNVLMLRASLEDCSVDLGDKWLCGKGDLPADIRAVRAIITALWMHSPGTVINDLGDRKDKIIEDIAMRGTWFSPRQMYDRYVQGMNDKYKLYRKYQDDTIEQYVTKYYVPYQKASDMYYAAIEPPVLDREASKAADEIEKGINDGYAKYRDAVANYKGTINRAKYDALRSVAPASPILNKICDVRGDCPLPQDPTKAIEKAQKAAHAAFVKASGYPPDIISREEFVRHPKTAKAIHDTVLKKLREETGNPEFMLPAGWSYDRAEFKNVIRGIVVDKAKAIWDKKFKGKIKPGLTREQFFSMGDKMEDIPPIEDVIMSEEEFMRTQLVPKNRDFVESALAEMRAEAPLYGNGQSLEEKGKNFIRAAYIPAVALVLSLIIVMLTLARGVAGGLSFLERRGKFFPDSISPTSIRMGVMTVLVLMLVFVPYIVPNEHTSAVAYRKYLNMARERNVITASILDWGVHMQPIIYWPGKLIGSLGDGK